MSAKKFDHPMQKANRAYAAARPGSYQTRQANVRAFLGKRHHARPRRNADAACLMRHGTRSKVHRSDRHPLAEHDRQAVQARSNGKFAEIRTEREANIPVPKREKPRYQPMRMTARPIAKASEPMGGLATRWTDAGKDALEASHQGRQSTKDLSLSSSVCVFYP
jgi:hypothetical protein